MIPRSIGSSLVADGMKNREIAQRVRVNERSIRNYIYRILQKSGVSNRVELILYMFSHRDSENSQVVRQLVATSEFYHSPCYKDSIRPVTLCGDFPLRRVKGRERCELL